MTLGGTLLVILPSSVNDLLWRAAIGAVVAVIAAAT